MSRDGTRDFPTIGLKYGQQVPRLQISHEASFQRMGGGATRRISVTATSKCKENAYWKNKEREESGSFDHEFFCHHALFVGYNVTNTLYNTIIVVGKGVWGYAPRHFFINVLPSTLENAPSQAYTGMSEEPFG